MTPTNFEGWLAKDESSVDGKMVWGGFEPRAFEDIDVDIKVSHCGICGSDLHVLRSGWSATPYPVTVGHEIVGEIVRVGDNVKNGLKVGQRVGVGAQGDSCLNRKNLKDGKDGTNCTECNSEHEPYCDHMVPTYGAFNNSTGGKGMGGYATYHRANSHFVIPIPDGLDSADAAPLLCGGITVFSPIVHFGANGNSKPGALKGKSIGVVGVGGLGHFAVLFAKALGAEKVIGLSRSSDKRDDSLKLGCTEYIATKEDKGWEAKHAKTLDLIISTVSSATVPVGEYMQMLKRDGTYVQVGIPDDGVFSLPPIAVAMPRRQFAGSGIGSPAEISHMLQLCADQKIKPWIEVRPMKDANKAIVDLADGKPRYRYVLAN